MIYLYLEDIVANSLIEMNKLDGSRKVSLELAKKYGNEVINRLRENGYFAKMKLGDDVCKYFEKSYANYFTSYQSIEGKEYYLNQDRTIEEIELKFRKNLPEEVSSVFDNTGIQRILLTEKNNVEIPIDGTRSSTLEEKNSNRLVKRILIKEKK